jgi:hypothetical protein
VSVTDTAGAEQKGKILDLSPTALTLAVDDARREYPAARVSSIKKHQRTSLGTGALIGLGVGAVVGAALGIAAASTCSDSPEAVCFMIPTLFCAGIGTGAGLGIAALMPGKLQTIYQAASASGGLRVTVAPFVVPQRQGIAVRVSF